jgi:predicted nuclease with TOPRIM domain
MSIEEIRSSIAEIASKRVPSFEESTRPGAKIAALEEFMLTAAYARGDLEEHRILLEELLGTLRARWEGLEGWEMVAGPRPSKEDVRRAKARLDPTLAASIDEVERLLTRIDRQVRRLERDEATASRAYSLVTGG